ncbi:DICT sensory domain-containing protein [Nostoc sp. CCY0012]|uniref:DICT sensory domain-containing protein n=1 Tax=Nostoc sp. CCY0012 TaxID=1056123 RepID=UPI0039C66F5D
MNDSQRKNLSVYRLALGVHKPPQVLSLNLATLLSLVRSHIDLLVEQQITATLWVKLPPGKIWHAELSRYQSAMGESGVIYNCQTGKIGKSGDKQAFSASSPDHICIQLPINRQLQREYFLIVLSPQFCSLILAHRPLKRSQTPGTAKVNVQKKPPILAITTHEGRIIQPIVDGIKQAIARGAVPEAIAPESALISPSNFICPSASEPALLSQLLIRQLQQQNEINHYISNKRIIKLQQQNNQRQNDEQRKDEYLRSVCQELRTPLTHMKTALSLLNSPNLKPPQRQRYLQMLNTQCDRQSTLITGLLDLVDLEHNLAKTALELVNLADIVPGVVSTYQPVAQEKGIMLAYNLPNELPDVWCVIGGLRQIVINLLHNSIKFTPNGGQVWVKARVQGDYVQLEFRDTGIGINENEISKIFDCFYRVRSGITEDMGGAGLGLTIVKRLLWRCGGAIYVKSKVDEGTTFIVNLPRVRKIPRAIA